MRAKDEYRLISEAYLQEGKITNYFANIGKALFGKTKGKMTVGKAEKEKLAEILAQGGDAAVHQFLETLEKEGKEQFEDYVPTTVKRLTAYVRAGVDNATSALFSFLGGMVDALKDANVSVKIKMIRDRVNDASLTSLTGGTVGKWNNRAEEIVTQIYKRLEHLKVIKRTSRKFPNIKTEISDVLGEIKALEMEFIDITGIPPDYDRSIWK